MWDAIGCSDSQKDTDSDGVNDDIDLCPETPTGESVNSQGCSASQVDSDGDSVNDDIDINVQIHLLVKWLILRVVQTVKRIAMGMG